MGEHPRMRRQSSFPVITFTAVIIMIFILPGCDVQVHNNPPAKGGVTAAGDALSETAPAKSLEPNPSASGGAALGSDELAERISSKIAEKMTADPDFIDAVSTAVATKLGTPPSASNHLSAEASAGKKKNEPRDELTGETQRRKFDKAIPLSAPLAVFGDSVITKGDFFEYLNRRGLVETTKARGSLQALGETVDDFLNQRLLVAEAREKGCENDPRYLRRIEEFKRRYSIETYVNSRLKEVSFIKDEEARAYYDEHISQFKKTEQAEFYMILVDDPVLAAKLRDRIGSGEDFSELAAKYSVDRSRSSGGYLGFIDRGKWPTDFENLAFSLEFGEIGGPIDTDFGHHIVLKKRSRPAMNIPFESAKDSILSHMRKERKPIFMERLTTEIRRLTGTTIEEAVVEKAMAKGIRNVPDPDMGKTVFSIGEKPFSVADLVRYASSFPEGSIESAISESGGWVGLAKRIMNEELLYAEALKKGFEVPQQSLDAFVDSMKSMAVSILFDSHVRQKIVITPDAPRAFYEQNRDEFTIPSRFLLHAIVAADQEGAETVQSRLRAGEAFETLAKTASADTVLAAKSGALGWVSAESLPDHVTKVLKTMRPGDVSAPIVFNGQFYIIRTDQVEESRIPPFDEVAKEAELKVRAAAYEKLKEKYIRELRDQRSVKVDDVVIRDILDQLNRAGAYSSEALEASRNPQAADEGEPVTGNKRPSNDTAVAEIDGTAFTVGDLLREFRRLRSSTMENYRGYDGAIRVLGMYAERYAMAKEARRRGIDGRKAFKDLMSGTSKATAMEMLIREKALSGISVAPDAVAEYYENNRERFEFAQARILLNKNRADAEKAIEVFRNGTSFPEVVKSFSSDPTAAQGGVIPPIRRSELPDPQEFYAKLFEAVEGSLIGPHETPAGWAYLLLEKRWTLPLNKVSEDIGRTLHENLSRERARRYVEDLRAAAGIKVDGPAIEKGPAAWAKELADAKLIEFSGKACTGSDLVAGLDAVPPSARRAIETIAAARADFVEKFVNSEILFNEAQRLGVTLSPEYIDRIAFLTEVRLAEVLKEEIRSSVKPDVETLKSYWEKNREWFDRPETARISYIHFKCGTDESERRAAMTRAEGAVKRLREGEDFAKVADEVSDSKNGNGGDLGYFAKGDLVSGYDRAAFELPVGGISEPFFTDTGLHVVKVTERTQGSPTSFEDAREEVLKRYVQEEGTRQVKALPAKLRRELKLILDRDVLENIDYTSF